MEARLSSSPPPEKACGNQPQSVILELRDWSLGGTRQRVELSLWEALKLRDRLNELFQ